MNNTAIDSNLVLDLCVEEQDFTFSTAITKAIADAELEIVSLNDSIESVKELLPNCDKLDYILAASTGVLCGVMDIFLVGKPGESPLGNITDAWFAKKTMAFAKLCHPHGKTFSSLESALSFLEDKFKVPYDQTGLGDAGKDIFKLNAKNHHFKSLAHNPSVLGLFFSILDQFTNSSHFISGGQLISLQKADEGWELHGSNLVSKLFCGFANWIGHLVSDVSGSQSSARKGNRGTGIPSPLWTWTNDIIAIKSKLNIPISEIDESINQLALQIFEKGYDTRFQTAQSIPVFINEIVVRLIYSIRRLFTYFTNTEKETRSFTLMWKSCEPFSNPTVKRMLTVAHGSFCSVDLGDATIRAFIEGGGHFNSVEFVLRINVFGVGRFAISLFGEAKRGIEYYNAKMDADLARREILIVKDYIQGLKILQAKYDDALFLSLIRELENSEAYQNALETSAAFAEFRGVPHEKILKTKSDIDNYFGGK